MKPGSHSPQDWPDELPDEFCRDLVRAARADETEIAAAADAPFLYQQLRARIAAEPELLLPVAPRKFRFTDWFAHWRWGLTGAAALLLLVALTQQFAAPAVEVVEQKNLPAPTITPTPEAIAERVVNPPAPLPLPTPTKAVARPTARRVAPVRLVSAPVEEAEITTDFLPLTYVANQQEQSGEVMRVEMPRSALLALGLPVSAAPNDERVKADVLVGDDGLALAIRFVRSAR